MNLFVTSHNIQDKRDPSQKVHLFFASLGTDNCYCLYQLAVLTETCTIV
jgi:hypothetical protein